MKSTNLTTRLAVSIALMISGTSSKARCKHRRRAGERQVKDVNVSFVGASARIVQGTTFIFVKEPY